MRINYPETIRKYTDEEILQEVDFINQVGEQEISSATVIVRNVKEEKDFSALALGAEPEITIDGSKVSFFIKDTLPAGKYTARVLAETANEKRNYPFRLWVSDVFAS